MEVAMALDERSQEALSGWFKDQQEYILAMGWDWSGTGLMEKHQGSTTISLVISMRHLLTSDVTSLWRDADGVSINGVIGGVIHFGLIGRRLDPKVPEELAEWYVNTEPRSPMEWSFHS